MLFLTISLFDQTEHGWRCLSLSFIPYHTIDNVGVMDGDEEDCKPEDGYEYLIRLIKQNTYSAICFFAHSVLVRVSLFCPGISKQIFEYINKMYIYSGLMDVWEVLPGKFGATKYLHMIEVG